MSSGQELNTWRHCRFFLQFMYLLRLFQNNNFIQGKKSSNRAWHQDRLLKVPVTTHSVLTWPGSPMFWCHATSSRELRSGYSNTKPPSKWHADYTSFPACFLSLKHSSKFSLPPTGIASVAYLQLFLWMERYSKMLSTSVNLIYFLITILIFVLRFSPSFSLFLSVDMISVCLGFRLYSNALATSQVI